MKYGRGCRYTLPLYWQLEDFEADRETHRALFEAVFGGRVEEWAREAMA